MLMLPQVFVLESYVAGVMENGATQAELCREQGNSGGALFCGNARIWIKRETLSAPFVPTGLAIIEMSPMEPGDGAVTLKVACPLEPVTTSL